MVFPANVDPFGHANFADLQVHLQVGGGGIEKAHHVGPQKRLRDSLPGKQVGQNHRISAGLQQMLLRIFFAGAGNDFQLGIESPRSQHDVEVGGVGGGGGHQAAGAFNVGFAQGLSLGSVAGQHQPLRHRRPCPVHALLHDDKGHALAAPVPAPR